MAETDTKKIIAELEFRSNIDILRNINLEIKSLSSQISTMSKNIASVRTGPLTDINNNIRDQLQAINPLNNALTVYDKLHNKEWRDIPLTKKELGALESAKASLMELTNVQDSFGAAKQAREDVFFGKRQLTAFRQTKSEIIAGLQEMVTQKGRLIAQRGELKLRSDEITAAQNEYKKFNSVVEDINSNREALIGKQDFAGADKVAQQNEKMAREEAKYLAQSIQDRMQGIKASQDKLNVENKLISMTAKSAQQEIAQTQKVEAEKMKVAQQEIQTRTKIGELIDKQAMKEAAMAQKQQIKDFSVSGKAISMEAIDTKNLEIAQDLMKRTGLEANALTIGLKRLGMAIKGGKIIGPFNKEIKVAEINLKKLKAASVQFKMSLLSVMFAGMALQRVMGKALRSMITTYQKANEDSEGLGKSTWHLQAAFEFLKYSIVEALTQSPLFQMLVQWLVQVVAWFNKLSPDTKAMIGIGIAIVFVIGTLMLLVGQIGLAINGFAAMGISGGGAILGIVGKMLMWLAIAIAVGFIIKGLFKGFTDGTKQASGEGISFGKILGFMAQSFLFLMRILETGARIIGNGFMQMIDGLKSSFYMLKWLFGTIMNYVIDKFESVINGIIKGINAAIRGANALGARIKEVPELNIGFRADTEGALDEISKLGEQIKSRAAQLYNEMPDLKTLWEQSDVSGLVTPSGQVNQDNSVKVDVGAINVQGASEEVMRDANSLASTIKDQIMNEINDTYSQLNDSTS
jgi:hypothetical protein